MALFIVTVKGARMKHKPENYRKPKKSGRLGRLLALLPVSCMLLYPVYLAAQLDLVETEYASAALPAAFSGLRIVYLSDIHYGPYFKESRVRALAERVNALEPDVILLGGDYGEDAEGAIAFFQLHPGFKAKMLVAAVMGNHDRTPPESNLRKLMDAMEADGVMPLVNDAIWLQKDSATLALGATDDVYNGHPYLDKVAERCAGADFCIFLPHSPDILPQTYTLPGGPFYQLALCGHTHGGQIALFGHAVKSSSDYGDRYRSGWYHENGVDILVSNGVGTSWLPVRLGARPQIHLITLKRP